MIPAAVIHPTRPRDYLLPCSRIAQLCDFKALKSAASASFKTADIDYSSAKKN